MLNFIKAISCMFVILLITGHALASKSNITATIDEAMVNSIFKRANVSGSEHAEGFKVFGKPWYSITVRWSIENIRCYIRDGSIRCKARVRVKARNFSYTATAEGKVIHDLEGTKVVLKPQSLKVPLYIKPLGKRIKIRTINIVDWLPKELKKIKFDLFGKIPKIPVPNGEKLSIAVQNPEINIKHGVIEIIANVDII